MLKSRTVHRALKHKQFNSNGIHDRLRTKRNPNYRSTTSTVNVTAEPKPSTSSITAPTARPKAKPKTTPSAGPKLSTPETQAPKTKPKPIPQPSSQPSSQSLPALKESTLKRTSVVPVYLSTPTQKLNFPFKGATPDSSPPPASNKSLLDQLMPIGSFKPSSVYTPTKPQTYTSPSKKHSLSGDKKESASKKQK
ncbi:hypothetical protein BKA61DRAFT_703977 [Leptodontidium sp. MPI-SDFR-AT-0119]|nr:hypothetical protein BKA61DRAFT_703977 [Leptodontidium sp. MPI-SDFR-AT-0119]